MAQKEEKILPLFLQQDNATERLRPEESPYLKGISFDQNANPSEEAGNADGTGEGMNALVQSPTRSNQILSTLPLNSLPEGYNRCCGSFESIETDEFYYANFNGNGNHGIYVVNCDTGIWNTVIVDSNLPFTDDQAGFLAEHRWSMRLQYDANKNIIAKFLVYTNAAGWQGWINVIAAIATNGFNASLFPYWALLPPHFDRRELIEWATRPCMYNPKVISIPNTSADIGIINRVIDQAFQFAQVFNLTDGRPQSNLSPFSLPFIIKSEDFLNSPDVLSKKALLTLYAGSCMGESIDLYVRKTAKNTYGIASTVEWGAWFKYDRIYKYPNSDTSPSDILSTQYWLRTNPWANNNYDPIQNTIQYVFDNSKLAGIPIIDTAVVQNGLPIKSVGLTDIGDAALLGDNLYGYDNLSVEIIENLDIQVIEKGSTDCLVPLRKLRLYAYIGRHGNEGWYTSQVGWHNGQNTQMRFGGLDFGGPTLAAWNPAESAAFSLDFADKDAFRCYLKGTPYYSDGQWYQVNSDYSLVKIQSLLDFSNNDVLEYVRNVYTSNGFFVCVFDFVVPAGRYIAAMGRHNVSSTGDYRNTSTYVYGIANSRIFDQINSETRTLRTRAIVRYSKEYEIDCTLGNVDVWGNGMDLFYINCPYLRSNFGPGTSGDFRFIEGYLQESPSNPIAMELFPYAFSENGAGEDWGKMTDKNGFYWGYTKVEEAGVVDIQIQCFINCGIPLFFNIVTNSGTGWRPNAPAYLSDHNGGIVGDCNRVIFTGKITSLDGTLGYSNISISIVDGETVVTRSDGTFELIIHNGLNTPRSSNVYVNASGNFLITISNCGYISLYHYNEILAPCFNCQKRVYPVPLILGVNVQGGTQYSLKENGSYSTGLVVADLAGRMTFVNIIKDLSVSSFLQRDDTLATFFRMLIKGPLDFGPDMKWFAPYVSNQLNILNYIQWVGDSIQYIDNNGGVVSDVASAVFVSISIQSLYNNNISRNFSILSTYQFTPDDRIRILDDGNGNLLDVADFGSPIDLQVLGTNYNQAAMAAGIIPNTNTQPTINNNVTNTTTVNTANTPSITTIATVQNSINVTLYVKYDARLDKLIGNTGFWIEIYTPSQQSSDSDIPYNELEWKPIINGEIADFTGYSNGLPAYNYPTSIDINFWDTYLFPRNINIPFVGDKFFSHPFESPNISDTFGYHVTSGGRKNFKNDDAKQEWFPADLIKSNDFSGTGIINGLGTFKSSNRKDFSQYPFGPINMMKSQRSIIFVLCQNDWFVVSFDFHFVYPDARGVMITNLDNNISTPNQKIGNNFGLQPEDTGSVIIYEEFISWYDRKNQAWVISDYKTAKDISLFNPNEGVVGGMSSYLNSKSRAISEWNKGVNNSSKFDVIGGVDLERGNLYLTFRPRRKNSNDLTSYINQRRGIDLLHQETLVYNTITRRFTRFENFTPEAYGKMRGKTTGIQLVTFAAGIPYTHNTGNDSFNMFYSIQTDSVIVGVFNQNQDINKIFANLVLDINGPGMYIDFLRTNEPNSFSYVPMNLVNKKENKYYLSILRDMVSYFAPIPENEFRSTLIDGKRIYNLYLLFRLIGDPNNRGKYFELKVIYNLFTDSTNEKK